MRSQKTASAISSRPHSSISTPRLTPLRMVERNRASDKSDIDALESKIQELERAITTAKQAGENKKLDQLEQSIIEEPVEQPKLTEEELDLLKDCMIDYGSEDASEPREDNLYEAFGDLEEFLQNCVIQDRAGLEKHLQAVRKFVNAEKMHKQTQCDIAPEILIESSSDELSQEEQLPMMVTRSMKRQRHEVDDDLSGQPRKRRRF